MPGIRIDENECAGCGMCVQACLYNAVGMNDDNIAQIDRDKCILCGTCVAECPEDAIRMDEIRASGEDRHLYHGIWVYAEHWGGKFHDAVFELLAEARKLADTLDEYLGVIAVGSKISSVVDEFFSFGAETVYVLEDDKLAVPNDETYAHLIVKAIRKYRPAVILYGATAFGRSLAPRIAAKLNTGLTADCTKLAIDPGKKLLLQTRPAFGGNVMATIICPEHRPQMATVRPGVFKKQPIEGKHQGRIIHETVDFHDFTSKTVVEQVMEFDAEELRIEDAEIVVAGGAGFANVSEFAWVRDLADLLGGSVGGSRCAVDACFCSPSSQIGQTGKVIAPKVYIAAAISGAVQHLVGMENSSLIIAINKDPDAAIFQIADFGIIGDALEVLPALVKAIKSEKMKMV